MATKRKGFWKDYSKQVVEMTREKNKKDPMDAFWCLNKALLDLYKVMDNKGGPKEVNRYSGYVLHFVVLLDTIALNYGDFDLNYAMDDPNSFDPLCKSTLLSVATSLSGIARTFWVEKRIHNRGDPDRDEWESLEYNSSGETCHMLKLALTRVLRYIKTNTDLSLCEMAEQHVDIFYGREPTPARAYDVC
jgi:hypothetical protein